MRSKRLLAMAAVAPVLILFTGSAGAVVPGDVDGNGRIELKDAILAMWAASGLSSAGVEVGADVNSDGVIGLAEVLYDLQVLAGFGGGRARAVLGPLAGATVEVYRLSDLEKEIYTATTDAAGYFDTSLLPEDLSKYVLVAVSGGQDTDADDDGVTDGTPTPNLGTIHGLMTAAEFASGGFQVTALSDIVWQYTKNLVGDVDASGLKLRLDELAKTFFKSDLNGDGAIDADDVLNFVPMLAAHQEKLNFDFSTLFAENIDGHSIIGAYHSNLPEVLIALLEERFWGRLTQIPEADIRYDRVKVQVAAFGRGSLTSDVGGIDIDSERTDPSQDVTRSFFDRSSDGKVILTASPVTETEILSWQGCDSVSADKTRCEVSLLSDRLVSISFGYQETILQEGVTLVDLSGAAVTASADQVTLNVTAGADDTDMMTKLAGLKAGDIVVSASSPAFLRSVISVQKVSDSNYVLTTGDASLEDVLAQGTAVFSKQMTQADLDTGITGRSSRSGAPSAGGFEGIDGVRLLPSGDPDSGVFTIEIGNPRDERATLGIEDTLSWKDPGTGFSVSVKGKVEVSIDVDMGFSIGMWPPGVEYVKFIPEISASESLMVTVGGEVKTEEGALEKQIGTLHFAPIVLFAGPVPVSIKPEVKIILGLEAKAGGEITAGITLKQSAKAGIIYDRDKGVETIREFSHSRELTPPTGKFYAEVKPFLKTSPVLYLYGVTGPGVELEGFLRLRGEAAYETFSDDRCAAGVSFTAYAGIGAGFEWDLGKAKKLGKWTEKIKLNFSLFEKEIKLKEWNVDGVCDPLPPVMEVSGLVLTLTESVVEGTGGVVAADFMVRNVGDSAMDWHAAYPEDGILSASPLSGTLAEGDTATVRVSVDTDRLGVGVYENEVKFINEYDESLIPGGIDGSTSRSVMIVVTPPPLAAPVLSQPQMAKDANGEVIASKVNLSWNYPDAATLKYVEGYVLWKSRNPDLSDAWSRVAVIGEPGVTSYQVANLLPDTTWYFGVNAYGTDVARGVSDYVSIKTPAVSGTGPTGDFTNSLGMTFNLIPAGTFMMGSPEDELGAWSWEWPQHQVTLTNDFYIMTTEVTQAQWRAVMGSDPPELYFKNCGDDCPVERVSWNDIQDFIAALNAKDGRTYRLPTEAEWEYAARAGSTTAFANGDITETGCGIDPNLDAMGWYCGNSDSTTHPVGQKQPNAWGLYDMHGNVWEWVEDDWHSTYDGAPTDGSAWVTGESSDRVIRGGSWSSGARGCRSADRYLNNPTNRDYNGGFRLALSPSR